MKNFISNIIRNIKIKDIQNPKLNVQIKYTNPGVKIPFDKFNSYNAIILDKTDELSLHISNDFLFIIKENNKFITKYRRLI